MAKKTKKNKTPVPQTAEETQLQRTLRARQYISEYIESNFNELFKLRSATLAVTTACQALGIMDNNLMVEIAHSAWVEAVGRHQVKGAVKDELRQPDPAKLAAYLEKEAAYLEKESAATIKVFSEALEKALLDPAPAPPSLVERVYIRCKRIWAAMKS